LALLAAPPPPPVALGEEGRLGSCPHVPHVIGLALSEAKPVIRRSYGTLGVVTRKYGTVKKGRSRPRRHAPVAASRAGAPSIWSSAAGGGPTRLQEALVVGLPIAAD